MQYPIYNLLCWKPKINEWKVKALACQFVVMRKLPQWHKSHTNKCFIKELRGKMAQVITEEQKTLMIWLAIDCVCVIASGCLVPIHRNQGQESWTIAWECVCISGCCTSMFTTNIKKNKKKSLGTFMIVIGSQNCTYFILCGQFVYWLYDQIYKLKELCGGQTRFPTRIIIFISGNEPAASHWA